MRTLRHLISTHRPLFAALLVLALAMRAAIPVGWMPSSNGQATLTICTGNGMVDAWVDASGKLHKSDPAKSGKHEMPCAFSGIGVAIASAASLRSAAVELPPIAAPVARLVTVSIGQGLTAPPPPQTGPPSQI